MNFHVIPQELRERPQWVLWRLTSRAGTAKPTKVPYRASDPSLKASSTDPATWAPFQVAVEHASEANGIGFVFSPHDPFFGVDVDAELSDADQGAVVAALDTYTERSVGGGGFHCIGRGQLTNGRHPRGLGVFDRDRYFVMTGEHVRGTPATIEPRQTQLEAVLEQFLPAEATALAVAVEPAPVDLDDRELLDRAFAARNGADVRMLYAGGWQHRYTTQSEADLALCTHLAFWTGRDPDRVDRLFRSSGLYRPKWERGDYAQRTIAKAIASTAEVYTPARILVSGPIGIEPAGIEKQGLPVDPGEQSSPGAPTGKHLPFERLAVMVEQAPAEPAWKWNGYLALFALALLAGRPKVGKSTLMMALVAAAVRDDRFLGLAAAARGVLVLTEERRDTLAEKARILGLMDEDVPVYVLTRHDAANAAWPEVVKQAITYCREHDLDVLVVDTLDRWTGLRGDAENAAGAVNEAMEPLQFAAAAGLAVLAVSHQRKSGGEYGEAVRGSNAFTGAVDVVIELERPSRTLQLGSHARVLRAVSRFTSTPEELFCELADDGFVAISDVAEKQADAERAATLDLLEGQTGPVGADVLAEATELSKRTLRRRLAELRERGLAERSGAGKKGDPYLWAAVADRDEETPPA